MPCPSTDNVRYIHVARDGRDACMSLHNHYTGFTDSALAQFDEIGMADETIGAPFPRIRRRTCMAFWREWIEPQTGRTDAARGDASSQLENSYWTERGRENLLLVHYNDLKADLEGEMRRIAKFLDVDVNEDVWPALVKAARFVDMKAQGRALLPGIEMAFQGGHETFLYRGTNERWRGVLNDADLALYEKRTSEALTPGLKAWLAEGRLKAGDPKTLAD